jgi:hypothetical protein
LEEKEWDIFTLDAAEPFLTYHIVELEEKEWDIFTLAAVLTLSYLSHS